MREFNFVLIG